MFCGLASFGSYFKQMFAKKKMYLLNYYFVEFFSHLKCMEQLNQKWDCFSLANCSTVKFDQKTKKLDDKAMFFIFAVLRILLPIAGIQNHGSIRPLGVWNGDLGEYSRLFQKRLSKN